MRLRPIVRRSIPDGNPFIVWEPILPRIPDPILDTVVYLYPTVEEARRGATRDEPGFGGTGFIVRVPIEGDADLQVTYIVTNSHVVGPLGRSPVVRINTIAGGSEVLPLTPENWLHHPDGDDVAVAPIGLSPSVHKYRAIDWNEANLLMPEKFDEWKVGPGDDVFFVGRFRYQEGTRRNLPTVRFGVIARLPLDEPVSQKSRGFDQESYIIEARSISGYSGSPVFLFIGPFSWRGELVEDYTIDQRPRVALLGIDWGHQSDFSQVLGPDRETPHPSQLWASQNSGIMMVVPVERIDAFLIGDEDLKEQRRVAAKDWHKAQRGAAALDVSSPPLEPEPTREEFFGDLRKIKKEARKPEDS
jgi:hypothetical protein